MLAVCACEQERAQGNGAVPTTSATTAEAASTALTQAAIDAVAEGHRATLAAVCAEDIRRARDKRVDLLFEIDAAGKVTDATVAGGGSAERPLRKCVEGKLSGWTFPAPGEARTVSTSLTF